MLPMRNTPSHIKAWTIHITVAPLTPGTSEKISVVYLHTLQNLRRALQGAFANGRVTENGLVISHLYRRVREL